MVLVQCYQTHHIFFGMIFFNRSTCEITLSGRAFKLWKIRKDIDVQILGSKNV